ncbi:unnamed protein product [Caenorhabditis bovis]|uniref:MOSC domain-containing protein n=1 Tax=Caenorhabditis bovis TaxID=2654633 RepID=A0A8S1E731_9PELO|nr:unnamed protein product [Caenorhabditis bovis]
MHFNFCLISFLFVNLVNCQQKKLLKYLFNDYHKELRPVKDEASGATNVTVQLYFKQIQKVHENDQIITLYCWIEEYWQDEFLTWDPEDYGGIKSLHVPSEMIWKPDLLVYNNANMNIKGNEMQTNVQIENTGKISLFRSIITDITCDLQMEKFPYDQQICYIMLASWSYDGSQIMLHTAEEPTQTPIDVNNISSSTILNHYIPNMEWKLIDFRYRKNLKFYDCCTNPYPDISYFFAIKRNPSYYLFTLIIPSAFITIVTVIGFFTPHSSTGENTEKVSLGVTALLSLAIILMMVSDKLPATSNSVPLLGQYYIGLIFIMFLATYCTTFTLGIQMQGNAGRPITRRLRSFLLSIRMNRNSFLIWFFGRELMNTQESIKMRLKKYDKLSALKKAFASDFISFQQKLFKTDTKMNKNPAPLVEQDVIDCSKQSDPAMYSVLMDILNGIQAIRQDMISQEHLRRIRKEWQMLARMLEKLIMWFFTISTVIFASFMLYDTQDPTYITDSVMRTKKRKMVEIDHEKKILIGFIAGSFVVYHTVRQIYSQLSKPKLSEWIPVGTVASLHLYPIKSCKPVDVFSFKCTKFGAALKEMEDRSFLVVDENTGRFYTARQKPCLVNLRSIVESGILTVEAPNKDPVRINLEQVVKNNKILRATLFENLKQDGFDCGDEIANYIKEFIQEPNARLIYYKEGLYTERTVVPQKEWWNNPVPNRKDDARYCDLAPFLLITDASLEALNEKLTDKVTFRNFRPSIRIANFEPWEEDKWAQIKIGDAFLECFAPCTRCVLTTVDPVKGTMSPENQPLKKLREFRLAPEGQMRDAHKDSPVFGVYAATINPAYIHVGQTVYARFKSSPF